MKKTLIALFSLVGLAMADTYTSSTPAKSGAGAQGKYFGFTLAPANDTYLTNDIPADIKVLTLESITLLSRSDQIESCPDIKVAVYAYTGDHTTGTYLGVSTNSTGTAAADTTYTLNFTGITIDPNERYQFLYVNANADVTTLSTFAGYQAASAQWGTSVTNSFGTNIPAGWGTYKSNGINSWEGQYVPVTTITLSAPSVPEPATATLSLLALAGLAARRRRASRCDKGLLYDTPTQAAQTGRK